MDAISLVAGSASLILSFYELLTSLKAVKGIGQVGTERAEVESIEMTLRALTELSNGEGIIGDTELTQLLSHASVAASAHLEAVTRKSSRSKLQQLWRVRKDRETVDTIKDLKRILSLLHLEITL